MKTTTFVRILSVSLCAIMMALVTGCNFNAPQQPTTPTDPKPEDNTPVAVRAIYTYGTHKDQLKFFKITVEYYDSDGTKKKEQIKEDHWSKTVQSKSLQATFGMRILYELNTNYSISPTKVELISYYLSYSSSTINESGLQVGKANAKSIEVEEECASAKLEKWLESYSSHPSSLLIKYDSKGNGTPSSWE